MVSLFSRVLWVRVLPALLAVTAICDVSLAQAYSQTAPMPFRRKTVGWLVADTNADGVYLCRDFNGDGLFTDLGETVVFFDATGVAANGLTAGTTDQVLSMYQAADGTVYLGTNARSVIAIRDFNLDGSTQSAGEARTFFDESNASGFLLPTPNGIAGDGAAIYVMNTGTSGQPQDGIFRLVDPNGLGGANGTGEQTLFLDLNTIIPGAIAAPFDLCAIGGRFYFADNRDGATPDRIYTCADTSGGGMIEAGELSVFHTAGGFGAPSGAFIQTCVTDGTSIFTHDRTGSVSPQRFGRLTDGDNNNAIDNNNEVQILWSETNLPAPSIMATSQGIAVAPGAIAMVSNGSGANEIILARDLTNNGLFSDEGDSTKVTSGVTVPNGAMVNVSFPGLARQIIAYGWPCPADFTMTGGVSVADIFAFLTAWFAGNTLADFNGQGGVNVPDIFDFLAAWFGGC